MLTDTHFDTHLPTDPQLKSFIIQICSTVIESWVNWWLPNFTLAMTTQMSKPVKKSYHSVCNNMDKIYRVDLIEVKFDPAMAPD